MAGIDEFVALEAECDEVIRVGHGVVSCDVKTVAVKVSNLKKASTFCVQVLATMSRASGRAGRDD